MVHQLPEAIASGFSFSLTLIQVSLIYAYIFIFQLIGDPYEIRTRVAGVRGRSLRPLDQRATICTVVHKNGAPSGTRTRDTLIKSQVLYQLS